MVPWANDQKLVGMTNLLVWFLTISKKPFFYMFIIWGDRLMTKGVNCKYALKYATNKVKSVRLLETNKESCVCNFTCGSSQGWSDFTI